MPDPDEIVSIRLPQGLALQKLLRALGRFEIPTTHPDVWTAINHAITSRAESHQSPTVRLLRDRFDALPREIRLRIGTRVTRVTCPECGRANYVELLLLRRSSLTVDCVGCSRTFEAPQIR